MGFLYIGRIAKVEFLSLKSWSGLDDGNWLWVCKIVASLTAIHYLEESEEVRNEGEERNLKRNGNFVFLIKISRAK